MPSFTLIQLRYFLAVAETGSFAAAATRERVSATAVASAVGQLEQAVGAKLCIRRRAHGVELTRSGHVLRDEAVKLLRAADEVDRTVAGGGQELVGPLVVGCYGNFAPSLLPGLIEGFSARNPRVDVDFHIAAQDVLQAMLFDGRIDVALMYDIDLRHGVEKRRLYEARVYLLMSADHRLADREAVSLEQLKDDPYILFDSPPAGDRAMSIFADAGIEPHVRFRSEQFELTRALVARNLGYCMMIYRSRSNLSYEGLPLVEVALDPPVPSASVVLAWTTAGGLSARAAAFIDFAERYIDDHHDDVLGAL